MGWGRGTLHIFLTKPWNFQVCYFTLGNSGKNKASPLEILEICVTLLGNSTFFPYHPWILYIYILCLLYTWKFLAFTTPVFFFFFGIAHYICLNCYFSRFCRKFYKVFFLIIPSDVSKGSLGIPLPTPKETDMRRGSKLNVGNYLVDEISRIFFYIACKVQNLLS